MCFLGRTSVDDFLLTRGVDPAAGTSTGLSAFHWSANRGNLDIVNLLIERKAPRTEEHYGGTVLGHGDNAWKNIVPLLPAHERSSQQSSSQTGLI